MAHRSGQERKRRDVSCDSASTPPDTLRAGLAGPQATLGAHAIEPPNYLPGDVLADQYELIELIGEGSMGAVWRARNLALDVDVALKLLRRERHVPEAAARLLREGRAAARVAHRAAVRIFDLSATASGEPFMVMELLNGRSLAHELATSGPMPPVNAVQLLLPIIGALTAAHKAGVVHRDVKPANIVLVQDGHRVVPKLIDFGIAALTPRSQDGAGHGTLVGSPAYMAPEQVRGEAEPDPRSDVWSVSVLLYELVTGARPFGGPGSISIVHDVLRREPERPEPFAVHPQLWDIVTRGLAKALGDRWPSMSALGCALAQWAILGGAAYDVTGTCLVDCWLPRA